jgi:signal transduction histidine kinase
LKKNLTIRQFLFKNYYLLVVAAWLVTFSFIIDNYWSSNASLESVHKRITSYVNEQENDYKLFVNDGATISKAASGNYDADLLFKLQQKKYFLFFYKPDETESRNIICWNTQQVLPLNSMLQGFDDKGFELLGNGYYVWHRYKTSQFILITLIPVKWNYFISNDYLQNEFVFDKTLSQHYDIGFNDNQAKLIRSTDGTALFYVYEKSAEVIEKNNPVAIVLQILAILLVLLFLHLMANFLAFVKQWWVGALFLMLALLFIRIGWYYYQVPLNFRQFELFDPSIYGSGKFNRSLGDLLINALFFVWYAMFLRQQLSKNAFSVFLKVKPAKWILLLVGSLFLLFFTFGCSNIIRSLVADSQVSFDVINFFTLSQFSAIGFVILCCISIGYFFICQAVVYYLKPLFSKYFYQLFLVVAVSGLAILTFRIGNINGGFEIYVLAWLILFLILLNSSFSNLFSTRFVSSKLVFWLFFFSVSISVVMVIENNFREVRNRYRYAVILASKADPANETLINTMLTDFRPDFLTKQFSRFSASQASNLFLKDSLISTNTTGYTNKFDTHIYTFNAAEKALYNEDSTGFNEINTVFNTQSRPTGINGLYYFDQSFDQYSFISRKTLKDSTGRLIGYVFILASPKKQRREALYPELFSKGRYNSIENSTAYAFAVYNNWKLVNSHNDYPFPSVLKEKDFKAQQFNLIRKKNHTEIWYYAGAGKMVVIAKEKNSFIESITLFSYLFCSFLLISALFWLINALISARFNKKKWSSSWQLSIRNQIHGTIIFISIVSFIVIGIATILFFVMRYEDNNREKLSRTIRIMEKEVKNTISSGWRIFDTAQISESSYNQKLEQAVEKISEIHGVDVNLYDLKGNLRVSSLPLPYIKGILSTRMDPMAFYHLSKLHDIQYFQKEEIGKLSFMSNYVPVIDAGGNNYAYLNIPYFTSQSKLKQEISNFLVTIINLNAFIFLLAGIVSLFITNRITQSFSVISDKMKKINLGTRNEAIEWNKDDEIGALVLEYNKMVNKLDESADQLAKTEREGAWKEMARQVAHEIKNPLTPMKLSMQFLQRAIETNAPQIKELSDRVAGTLIEQINHLNQIANEFSQFAQIGESKKELFNLNEAISSVLQLYATNNRLHLIHELLPKPVMILADKTQINRLFTNLILNAIQSVPEGSQIIIEVHQHILEDNVLTRITDNGQGISESIQPRIFTPNFTTKNSGTGLGLAMCKRIVEQAEGEIWFETTLGKGTSFFVKIPLAG